MEDALFTECRTALEIAAAGGDPTDAAPGAFAPAERMAAWETVQAAIRPALYAWADWVLAAAQKAVVAGDLARADALRALTRARHYDRVRTALAEAGLPTPEPRASEVAAWRAHYEEYGVD